MNTPSHDEKGRPLLSDAEYERLHMMDKDEFERLPEATKELYYATHEWHRAQRQGGSTLDPSKIKTSDGLSQEETIALWKKAQTQTGK